MALLNISEVDLIQALRARGGMWAPDKGEYSVVPAIVRALKPADARRVMRLLVSMRERQLIAIPLSRRLPKGDGRLPRAVSKREDPDPSEWDVESVTLLYAGTKMYTRHMSGTVLGQPDALPKVAKEPELFSKGAKPPGGGKPPARRGRSPKLPGAAAPPAQEPASPPPPPTARLSSQLALSVPLSDPYELVVLDLLRVRPISFADDAATAALQLLETVGLELPDDRQVALAEMRATLSELEEAGEIRIDWRPNLTQRGLHLRTAGRRRLYAHASRPPVSES